MKDITNFQGKYFFLSNFFIEPDGTHVEGEFQMHKCAYEEDKKLFEGLTPLQAKKLGNRVRLVRDWDLIKYGVMMTLVEKKFHDHPHLRRWLIQTDNAKLIEENTWGDKIWGTVNGKGKNWLGNILMHVRAKCRNELCERIGV